MREHARKARITLARRGRAGAGVLALAGIGLLGASPADGETYRAINTEQLVAAVAKANANKAANTIVLAGRVYLPTEALTFTNTTGRQTVEGHQLPPVAKIDGGAAPPTLITVGSGVSLTLKNVEQTGAGLGAAPALEDFGTLEIAGSTLAGNFSPAVKVEPGASATLRNSTLSYGFDFGLVDSGTASFVNSTVAFNNGGGIEIENRGTLNLTNTIVAENSGGDCVGKATTTDHSLDSDGSCGVTLSNMNPLLDSNLIVHGGSTPTHALQPGSPGIDAGDAASCPATDQRGFPRPDIPGTACDIGAYEFQSPPSVSTPNTAYMALGDSLAFGYSQQLFNENKRRHEPPGAFERGYVNDYQQLLEAAADRAGGGSASEQVALINDGCPDETTDSLIGNGPLSKAMASLGATGEPPCPYHYGRHFRLHHEYGGRRSQLESALAVIASRSATANPVSALSLNIGDNDVLHLARICEADVKLEYEEVGKSQYQGPTEAESVKYCESNKGASGGGEGALDSHILDNITAMLFVIRNGSRFGGVNYRGKIIVLGYYDPYGRVYCEGESFASTGKAPESCKPGPELQGSPSSNQQTALLNFDEKRVVEPYAACYADPRPKFNPFLAGPQDNEPFALQTLTNMNNKTRFKGQANGPDVNPTPLGYEELAKIMHAACG
jgi:hypothetical protein